MNTEIIENKLNELYQSEINKYVSECEHWKRMGYKVYRNSEGQHKVIAPIKVENINTAFGGIFDEIFYGNVGN